MTLLRPCGARLDSKSRNEEAVTALTHKFLLTFDWSPDGKWLLASEQNEEGGRTEIWTEPVPETIAEAGGRSYRPNRVAISGKDVILRRENGSLLGI
jgi:hypothetical protein